MDRDKFLNVAIESLDLAHKHNSGKDLSLLLGVTNSGANIFTSSGDNDSTYCKNDLKLPELGNIIKKSFPLDLTERLKRSKSAENCGIFVNHKRAWMTIDTEIYIWSFSDLIDLTYFDRFSNIISTIAIVKPKKDVFQAQYTNLLVVATIRDLSIFGVYFGDEKNKSEMHLNPDPFYVVKLDNFLVKCIEGAEDGRIFMGSEYGVLYEVEYQESYGIFGRRLCKIRDRSSSYLGNLLSFISAEPSAILQICIDDTRKMLYTRSQNHCLQAFTLTNDSCYGPCKLSNESSSQVLVHMAIVPKEYSSCVFLVAVTNTGRRLYYTATSDGRTFKLMHARAFPRNINNITLAAFDPGCCIMVDSSNKLNDQYVIASSDTLPYHSNTLIESYDLIDSLALSPSKMIWKLKDDFLETELEMHNFQFSTEKQETLSAILFQHYFVQKKFLFFSNNDIAIVSKLNHCEQLEYLLLHFGPDSIQLRSYFLLNQIQAFVSCLTLMASKVEEYNRTGQLAARTFFMYISDSSWNQNIDSRVHGANMLSPINASNSVRQNLNYSSLSSTPVNTSLLQSQGTFYEDKFKNTSLIHQSLFLFLDRILWPVYNRYLLNYKDIKKTQLTSSVSCKVLSRIISKLDEFKNLLQKYPELLNVNIHAAPDRFHPQYNRGIMTEEQIGLQLLQKLADEWRQMLCLWHLLVENIIFDYIPVISKDLERELPKLTFMMLMQRSSLCRQLINILIELYLKDNVVTDAITLKLRNNCPLFYSPADKNITKAEEYINYIKNAKNQFEKTEFIGKAVEQYMLACSEVDLLSMAQKLSSVGAYSGIVNIVLAASAKKDPNNFAVHFYNNKMPSVDIKAKHFFDERMHNYRAITQTLHELAQKNIDNNQASHPVDEQTKHYIDEMIHLVIKSNDQLAHISIFNWLFEVARKADILDSNSPYVEQYLVQRAEDVEEGPQWQATFELLCNFYIRIKKFSSAAKLFNKLAEKKCHDMSLELRVRYLSQACLCLQSSVTGYSIVGDADLLKEIQDKIEVSTVQQEILETITSNDLPNKNDVINQLNSQLFPITELFENFATRYNLSLCKLSLVSCANFQDPSIVEAIWKEIILSAIANKDESNYVSLISTLILELGRKYFKLEFYFPIVFLVNILEQLNVQHDLILRNRCFVADIFIKIGCSYEKLQETYDILYRQKDMYWNNKRQQLHLIHVACYVVSKYLLNTDIKIIQHNLRILNKFEDSLSFYLIEAESAIHKDDDLVGRIHQLQHKLNRFSQRQL